MYNHLDFVLLKFNIDPADVEQGNTDWKVWCPNHDDDKASLHVTVLSDGRVLVHCFAGCPFSEVLDAAGLESSDLVPSERPSRAAKNEVYRTILDELELSVEHTKQLRQRGLTDQSIKQGKYKSLRFFDVMAGLSRAENAYGAGLVRSVPGFGGGRPALTDGLVIPVMDEDRFMVAWQVRQDEGREPKYIWFSNQGAKLYPVPIHVEQSVGLSTIITEGALKAHIINQFWPDSVVMGIPGVSTWPGLFRLREFNNIRHFDLAFDMDWKTNRGVNQSLTSLINELYKAGKSVSVLTWEEGKGLDDHLLTDGWHHYIDGKDWLNEEAGVARSSPGVRSASDR